MTIDIGLLLFIITVIGNVAALTIDVMLVNTGQQTISGIAQKYRLWAIVYIIFEMMGVVGLAVHLL